MKLKYLKWLTASNISKSAIARNGRDSIKWYYNEVIHDIMKDIVPLKKSGIQRPKLEINL